MLDLKIYFVRKRLQQYQVAAQLGITQQYLSYIVNGKRKARNIRMRMVEELGFPENVVGLRKETVSQKSRAR